MFNYYAQRELHLQERIRENNHFVIDALVLSIASPDQIRAWSQRRLSNGSVIGEVGNSKTVDYKTFKPLRDGLFCERIFGPVKSFYCSCGKKQPNEHVAFCPECEVDYCESIVRRHRLGYIDLASPVSHIWYIKSRPNYIALLLGKRPRNLTTLLYCLNILVDTLNADILPSRIEVSHIDSPTGIPYSYNASQTMPVCSTFICDPCHRTNFLRYFVSHPEPDDLPIWAYTRETKETNSLPFENPTFESPWQEEIPFDEFLRENYLLPRDQAIQNLLAYTGGEAVQRLLDRLDLKTLMYYLAEEIAEITPAIYALGGMKFRLPTQDRELRRLAERRLRYTRRFKIAHLFHRNNKNPAWMILSVLPVLPPTLRPILVIDEQLVASDVNRLYQRVLYRNMRMKCMRILDIETIGFTQRLLQEAVDTLLENGKGGIAPVANINNVALKSLSDRLKGKQGRFRQNLLGKRVNYSGRSVIVVGPKLELHECGIPREMSLALFLPFIIRYLLETKKTMSVHQAKRLVEMESVSVWRALLAIMPSLPVLLNRAPTLHRLGIQAFQPHLVTGQAILLHPLVCGAYNADFDGDQMAVHVPLSFHARAEAWKLLMSRNNLLAPATGQPILMPSQDMVLGCYYLTTDGRIQTTENGIILPPKPAHYRGEGRYFNGLNDASQAFFQHDLNVHTRVWVKLENSLFNETGKKFSTTPTEIQINTGGSGAIIYSDSQEYGQWSISTDQVRFQESFWMLNSQYILTTIGRILVNQLFAKPDHGSRPPTKRMREHILSQLTKRLKKGKNVATMLPKQLQKIREEIEEDELQESPFDPTIMDPWNIPWDS